MVILSLDLSCSIGWALLKGENKENPVILDSGVLKFNQPILSTGEYPWCYLTVSKIMQGKVKELLQSIKYPIDVIVVEEINLGKRVYSQKILEYIHLQVLELLRPWAEQDPKHAVKYIRSSEWRKVLGINYSKEDKLNNKKIKEINRLAKKSDKSVNDLKKENDLKGKITKKHVAIRYVNDFFNLTLRPKDDDIADAICLALSYFKGARFCNGK